jgi:hypothetical protein
MNRPAGFVNTKNEPRYGLTPFSDEEGETPGKFGIFAGWKRLFGSRRQDRGPE